MRRYVTTLLLLAALLPTAVRAGEPADAKPLCPLFTAVEFEVGGSELIDTYLAPWSYKGWSLAVGAEWMRAMPIEKYRWVWQQQLRVNFARTRLRISGNGLTDAGLLHYAFAMMRYSDLPVKGLRLYYGADMTLTGGALYNYHGGNNPVSVKADMSWGLTAMAVYDFKLGRLPVTARYQLALPVVGVFAQPEYAESYYEVSLGNYENFLHAGTWATRFDMTNRLTIDFRFASWALRVGYGNTIYTTYTAGNRYQWVSHHFVVGFAGDLLRWSAGNKDRRVCRALYTL